MICQNAKKCSKGPNGPNGRACQKKSHDGCDTIKCVNIATNGPNNSRIYCALCTTQLKLKATHPCNSKNCIVCGKKGKAKYGKRVSGTPIRATHCCDCAKPFGYVVAGASLCSFIFEDKSLCNAQAKSKSKELAFCGTHAKGQETERLNTCDEEGCNLSKVIEGYCTQHGKARGLVRKDNCVDCRDTRGTFKHGEDLLCGKCVDKRKETSPDIEVGSLNRMCEVCHSVRPTFAPNAGAKPTRFLKCCDGLDWVSINAMVGDAKPKKKEVVGSSSKKDFHKCPHEGCSKSKAYGYASNKKRLVCFDHVSDLEEKDDDMIVCVISSRKCQCGRIARFGLDETTHCSECKKDTMTKLSKICESEGCDEDPLWGIRNHNTGRGKSIRCEKHKIDGDVCVGRILCRHSEDGLFKCDTRGTFKKDGIRMCKTHAGGDAVDTHRMCDHEECTGTSRAYFSELKANNNRLPPSRCHIHRTEDMVPEDRTACVNCGIWNVDVRDPDQKRICGSTCKECLFAQFLYICDDHRITQDDLDNIRRVQLDILEVPKLKTKRDRIQKRLAKDPKKKADQLSEIAAIDKLSSTPNLKEKLAATLKDVLRMIDTRINDPVIGEKFQFMINKFSLFLKRKEGIIAMSILTKSLEGHRVKNDRPIQQIGNRIFRRPDFYVQLDDHDIIIEIDEFSHSRNSKEDELRRMNILNEALGDRPLWIIRFNPDLYHSNGVRHESLFNTDMTLKSQKRYDDAMAELNSQIEYCVDHLPDNFEVIYMRYTEME